MPEPHHLRIRNADPVLENRSVGLVVALAFLGCGRIGYELLPSDAGPLSATGGTSAGGRAAAGGRNTGGGPVMVGGQDGDGAAGMDLGAGSGGVSATAGTAGSGTAGGGTTASSLPITVDTYAGTGVPGFEDGAAATATFNHPADVFAAPEGLYVADSDNAAIRLIDGTGTVTTVTGRAGSGFRDGPPLIAQLQRPIELARDPQGRILVADNWNHAIRRIELDGALSTLAGTGTAGYSEGVGIAAQFNEPQGIAVDASGVVFVADKNNRVIRRIAVDGSTSLYCGQPGNNAIVDGSCSGAATFEFPTGLELAGDGNLYVGEWGQHAIRKITPNGTVTTVLGSPGVRGWADGAAALTILSHPSAVRWDASRSILWFLDHDGGHRLRHFDGSTAATLFGPKDAAYISPSFQEGADPRFSYPEGLTVTPNGVVYIADLGNNRIRRAQ